MAQIHFFTNRNPEKAPCSRSITDYNTDYNFYTSMVHSLYNTKTARH